MTTKNDDDFLDDVAAIIDGADGDPETREAMRCRVLAPKVRPPICRKVFSRFPMPEVIVGAYSSSVVMGLPQRPFRPEWFVTYVDRVDAPGLYVADIRVGQVSTAVGAGRTPAWHWYFLHYANAFREAIWSMKKDRVVADDVEKLLLSIGDRCAQFAPFRLNGETADVGNAIQVLLENDWSEEVRFRCAFFGMSIVSDYASPMPEGWKDTPAGAMPDDAPMAGAPTMPSPSPEPSQASKEPEPESEGGLGAWSSATWEEP
jgi:hypothetical protein